MTTGNPAAVEVEALRDALTDAVAYIRGEITGTGQRNGILCQADGALARTPPVPEGAHDELVRLLAKIRDSHWSENDNRWGWFVREKIVPVLEALARKGEATGM